MKVTEGDRNYRYLINYLIHYFRDITTVTVHVTASDVEKSFG